MSLNYLHTALVRARDRHRYAKRNLERARAELNPKDPLHARSLRKIDQDLQKAGRDLAHAMHVLDQAREVEGLNPLDKLEENRIGNGEVHSWPKNESRRLGQS
jgi:hypothetical protein